MAPSAALREALARSLPEGTDRIGVAVSGGGDSMALMALLAEWAAAHGVSVHAASVDHGLRPEAADETALVARTASRLGIAHSALHWAWDGHGNLQACARDGRMAALVGWALEHGIAHVCLGHTRDDQAETVLLRLARGSGVDGLVAMSEVRRDRRGIGWLRPLLGVSREALRADLRIRGLDWAEDPGNADPRFDRIKARALLAARTLPGLGPERLAETAARMGAARTVLAQVARAAACAVLQVDHGAVRLALPAFAELADDTRWRILAACLCRVGGRDRRPRFASLCAAEAAALSGRRATLHGAILRRAAGALWVHREPASVEGLRANAPGTWDARWDVAPASDGVDPDTDTPTLEMLGPAGLATRPGWRRARVPRLSLLTSPALWRDGVLIAAPALDEALGLPCPWRARPLWDRLTLCIDLQSD